MRTTALRLLVCLAVAVVSSAGPWLVVSLGERILVGEEGWALIPTMFLGVPAAALAGFAAAGVTLWKRVAWAPWQIAIFTAGAALSTSLLAAVVLGMSGVFAVPEALVALLAGAALGALPATALAALVPARAPAAASPRG